MKLIKAINNKALNRTDLYSLFILSLFSFFALILYSEIDNSFEILLSNLLLSISIIIISLIADRFPSNKGFLLFRRLYVVPLAFFVYSQVQVYIEVINPTTFDDLLIQWDRAIFTVNPTEWLGQFSFPLLTEYLQFSYMTYFFMPVIHGIELHFKNDDKNFNDFLGIIIFSLYISYLLYFFMPAIGPRFTLHDFNLTHIELPGIWLTEFLRSLINQGGGIPFGAINPADLVNKDCMPSGHTMITLVNIFLAFKYKSRLKWIFFVFGTSLIFATVYLRYHYVVDIFAGVILAVFILWFDPKIKSFLVNIGLIKN